MHDFQHSDMAAGKRLGCTAPHLVRQLRVKRSSEHEGLREYGGQRHAVISLLVTVQTFWGSRDAAAREHNPKTHKRLSCLT
jgi:hypothetical protein